MLTPWKQTASGVSAARLALGLADSLTRVATSYRRPIIIAIHLFAIPLGLWLAFLVRFEFDVPAAYMQAFWAAAPLLLVVRLLAFTYFGLHTGWWRHAGIRDLYDLGRATTLSSIAFAALLFATGQIPAVPRSVLLLDWAFAIILFGGLRFSVRVVREERLIQQERRQGKRAIILGAGNAAERLLRHLRRDGSREFRPLLLLDDDPAKHGTRIHGVPVAGPTDAVAKVARRHDAELLVIAVPSASREEMQRLIENCMQTGVEFKIVPRMHELLDGTARASQLRKVEIEDLLGRDPIELDMSCVQTELRGSVVMVTGGAGSIGSELARQIARAGPARLVLLDQAESPLYFVHLELAQRYPDIEIVPVIADVADDKRMGAVFARHRPELVFHAAAYKHVPLMEANVVEAVRTNVWGTLQVAECAVRHGARRFVLISTDKAVNPSSVMGATKRIAERIVLGYPSLVRSRTDFRAVRFGNVLGSDGSVIPLFRRQLAGGGPLTVTDPGVTRYFMTIPEAVQLVLQAATLPEAGGRVSMLEMGEPVRIVDLAENLIRLSGLEPYDDIPIVFTGLRPGEKLHEELTSKLEATATTSVEKIRLVCTFEPDGRWLQQGLDRLAASLGCETGDEVIHALCVLVPECVAPLRDAVAAPKPALESVQHTA
jgi:FlaA1/EpsC-like NDP-sugar epimerase